jgi:hypothetical protein
MAVKAYSGRRPRADLPAAWFWIGLYGLTGLIAATGLASQGYAYLLWLAAPGAPVFAWHLYLVSRRSERRQMAVEIVGSGVLALAAPAGLWVGLGRLDPLGWFLFGLVWLQSAASIVYAFLRLAQRVLPVYPQIPQRLRLGRRALLYTGFNLTLSIALGWLKIIPSLLFIPFLLQFIETLWGILRPAWRYKPTTIGFRQLAVSSLFTLLFILIWMIS